VNQLKITVRSFAGCDILYLRGEIDLMTSPKLHDVVTELLRTGARRVVIDLSAVNFVDVSTLVDGRTPRLPRELRRPSTGATPPVRQVLEATGADSVLQIHQTLGDALEFVLTNTTRADPKDDVPREQSRGVARRGPAPDWRALATS
jgi:anti-sigma B factor antagonist